MVIHISIEDLSNFLMGTHFQSLNKNSIFNLSKKLWRTELYGKNSLMRQGVLCPAFIAGPISSVSSVAACMIGVVYGEYALFQGSASSLEDN